MYWLKLGNMFAVSFSTILWAIVHPKGSNMLVQTCFYVHLHRVCMDYRQSSRRQVCAKQNFYNCLLNVSLHGSAGKSFLPVMIIYTMWHRADRQQQTAQSSQLQGPAESQQLSVHHWQVCSMYLSALWTLSYVGTFRIDWSAWVRGHFRIRSYSQK